MVTNINSGVDTFCFPAAIYQKHVLMQALRFLFFLASSNPELPTHPARPMLTAVGFEPTPLRTGALSQGLRPLGQTVLLENFFFFGTSAFWNLADIVAVPQK